MGAPVLVVAFLICVLSAAGCGAESNKPQAESVAATTSSKSLVELGAWGVDMAEPELDGPVNLASELAVFSQPRMPQDTFPTEVVRLEGDTAEGRELAGESRLLIAGVAKERVDELGEEVLSLYAVPTDRGWVCAYVAYEDLGDFADGAAGGCEPGLVHGFGLELHGDGPFYRLYGVVDDGIKRVSLRVGDRLLPAHVGSNGLYFDARTTDVCPVDIEHLVVERADGRTTEVPWRELAPSFAGASRESFGCMR
jgi:hypothetical protein